MGLPAGPNWPLGRPSTEFSIVHGPYGECRVALVDEVHLTEPRPHLVDLGHVFEVTVVEVLRSISSLHWASTPRRRRLRIWEATPHDHPKATDPGLGTHDEETGRVS